MTHPSSSTLPELPYLTFSLLSSSSCPLPSHRKEEYLIQLEKIQHTLHSPERESLDHYWAYNDWIHLSAEFYAEIGVEGKLVDYHVVLCGYEGLKVMCGERGRVEVEAYGVVGGDGLREDGADGMSMVSVAEDLPAISFSNERQVDDEAAGPIAEGGMFENLTIRTRDPRGK